MLNQNISFIKSNVEGIFVWERLQSVNRIGLQVYLWRGELQGALLPIISTLSCDFDKYLYLKYSYTQMCRRVVSFQKSHDSIVMALPAPGEECHLDFSPKSCAYPTLVTLDPLEAEIISVLLCKNNCPKLFCSFTIDNSSYITTVRKKCFVYPCFQ